MALIVPAIQGKLGEITYYNLIMKAGELVEKAAIPSEQDDWNKRDLDDLFQRKVDYSRIRRKIAPYFANNSFRFSSAIIVALQDFEKEFSFVPLAGKETQMGLATIAGGAKLFVIDGQHRVLAIKYAIRGKDNNGKKMRGVEPQKDLAKEDVPVMLIDFEINKVRDVFIAVNETAKRTTTSENILIGEKLIQKLARDIAVMVFDKRLVKMDAKVLNLDDFRATTLSAIANCTQDIFNALHPSEKNKKAASYKTMGVWEYRGIQAKVERRWKALVNNNDFYQAMLKEKGPSGDRKRINLKKEWLISRAVVQECLFKAFALLIADDGPFYASADEAALALNKLPLKAENMAHWQPFLFSSNGKIINKNKKFTADLMAYLVAGDSYRRKDEVLKKYKQFFPDQNKKLPKLI